jgi:hypothetical protein
VFFDPARFAINLLLWLALSVGVTLVVCSWKEEAKTASKQPVIKES